MARFAFNPEPEVAPSGAPGNDYEQIQASPESFGASVARARGAMGGAEERLGAGIEHAGETGLDITTQWQTMQNHLHAAELKSHFDEGLTKLHTDYMQLEGRAALDARPEFEAKLKELRTQVLAQAPSQQEQVLLAPGLTSLSDQYARYWAGHAASQMRSYEKKVAGDRIANNAALAVNALNAGDEDSFLVHLHHQDMEVHNLLDGQGYDQEAIGAEAAKRRGTTIRTAVETMAAGGDVAQAQEIFERYKRLMDPQSVLGTTQYLRSGVAQLDGRAVADRITGHNGQGGPLLDKQQAYERVLTETDRNPLMQNAAIARLNQVYAIYHSETTTRNAQFDMRVKDSTAEALTSGDVKNPLTEDEFVQRYGNADTGHRAYQQYTADVQLGLDRAAAASLDPREQQALLDRYAPVPGEGYAAQVKRRDLLAQAIAHVDKEKHDDPATFAIERLPTVNEAWRNFSSVLSDANAPAPARTAAAREYAAKTAMEQQRIGVPAEKTAILPKGYVDHFNKSIAAAADSDDPTARLGIVAKVQQEAATWGDAWPQVMRQLAPGTQPIVRAIAAGADPAAMTRLLSLGKDENPAKLLKEQNETKAHDLGSALNDAMAPFLRTLIGRQKDRDYTGYYNLAEKLAALEVRDGKSPSDAAADAFKAVVGARYEFRDTFRIPKSIPQSPDDIQAGTVAARERIAQSATAAGGNPFGIKPAVNDIGLADPRADSLSKFARDGTWITAPDNGGLNLIYGDKLVRREDGKPFVLSWAQLAELGGSPEARAAATKRATEFGIATP